MNAGTRDGSHRHDPLTIGNEFLFFLYIKQMVITGYTMADFLAALADHVPDRYRHNIRYFGLLSPRSKGRTHDTVFALLGQERRGKPWRLSWAALMRKSFGVDPLLDSQGNRMRWRERLEPIQRR